MPEVLWSRISCTDSDTGHRRGQMREGIAGGASRRAQQALAAQRPPWRPAAAAPGGLLGVPGST
eukprot:CAMPEP_0206016962 /NCGR_PEP_ID=MMETSP1464-20131121/23978_1 /ASSEMBLY_ACC=CAM_ASM_001124 /TAXON_ID=119497 /ORGANISM="Exanthemachrysis gayraliae, Strain RCC1523" /LENGTH=63 /DNA_ID=CAMNT_0053390793 /DNA_START=239 /DNA_END=426 /DNA_ORIENTATION=+